MAGTAAQVAGFAGIRLDISDFPSRHPYGLALLQGPFEEILAGWIGELKVPIYREQEVTGFTQDDGGVDVRLADGAPLRAQYLVGCDGGRSVIRRAAGIEFPGWDPSVSSLIAEAELSEEPPRGVRYDENGTHALGKLPAGGVLPERPRAAGRRRRARALPGRRAGPQHRRAGRGEPGLEAGPGGGRDIAGQPGPSCWGWTSRAGGSAR
jgi:2-polyprenyl-6-methoxyphenol hydroxylase-like FAD-dependent oxidoreductase